MKFIKTNLILLIFIIVEGTFLIKGMMNSSINYEVFFFVWGIIWMMFFFYDLFGNRTSGALRGMGMTRNSDAINYNNLASSRAEIEFKGKEGKKDSDVFYSTQIMYGIMVVLNIIGYIVTYIVFY